MIEKDFDKRIGDKLRNYTEQAPRDLFAKIEKSVEEQSRSLALPVKRKQGLTRHIYRYTAVAAVMAVAVLGIFRFNDDPTPVELAVVDKAEPANVDVQAIVADEAVESSGTIKVVRKSGSGAIIKKAELDHILANTIADNAGSNVESGKPNATSSGTQLNYAKELEEAAQKRKKEEQEREIERYWMQMFSSIAEEEGRSTKRLLSSAVYLGNFGTGKGDITDNNIMKLASSGMLINNTRPSSMPSFNNSTKSGSNMGSDRGDDVVLRHRMPVSIGFTLTYPLSERVMVMSGLNYSFLYSESKQKVFMDNEGGVTQRLHYIGLPLRLKYTLYSGRSFEFYARAGGMVEYAVYATRECDLGSGGTPDISRLKVNNVQLSADAGLGVNFRLTKRLGLYAEPGIAYYIEGRNQPISYYSETPINFTFAVGLRFDFK